MTQRNDLFTYSPPPPTAATVDAVINQGIAASADHADEADPGWGDAALALLRDYAENNLTFMTEDVRAWAYDNGFEHPPAEGAWGSVARRAQKLRWIDALGKTPSKNPSQHGKMMTSWGSRLFEGRLG